MFYHQNILIGVAYIQRTSKESEESSATVHTVVPLHEINGLGMQRPSVIRTNRISRLNTDRDVFKGSTDTPRKATQTDATLNPVKRFRNPLRWQQMRKEEDGSEVQEEPPILQIGEDVRHLIY
jgi:hypothetical protein